MDEAPAERRSGVVHPFYFHHAWLTYLPLKDVVKHTGSNPIMHCRAICTDCGWSVQGDGLETVTDEMERHARKEQHHVEFKRLSAPV